MRNFFSQKEHRYLVLILFVLILLRIPSFFEPHWYTDEGIYGSVSYVLSQGGKLYQDVYDHKPQLLVYLYWLVGNPHKLLFIKLVNLVAAIVGTIFTFKLLKRNSSKLAAVVASAYFAFFTGSYFLEGTIANAENFFVPLSVIAIYLYTKKRFRFDFLAGITLGIAFLIKLHPVFDLAAILFVLFALFIQAKPKLKNLYKSIYVRRVVCIIGGFIIPFVVISLWEVYNNNFNNFIQAAFIDAYLYSGENISTSFFAVIFSLPFKTLLLFSALGAVTYLYYKKKLSEFALLAIVVFAFEFYGSVISGRYYPHYLLHPTLGFAICLGHQVSVKFRKLNKKKLFNLGMVIFLIFGVGEFFFSSGFAKQGSRSYIRVKAYSIYRGFDYYKDFLQFLLMGELGTQRYEDTYHRGPRKLRYLKSIVDKYNPEQVYAYTDNAWTYYYIERLPPDTLVVAFHLNYVSDNSRKLRAIASLKAKNVSFIAIDKAITPFSELSDLIAKEYRPVEENEYYEFYIKND